MAFSDAEKRRIFGEEKSGNEVQKKKVLIALFLSSLLAGLGDLYSGSWIKACVFFAVDVVCIILIFAQGLGFFLYAPVWVCGLMSAWMSASTAERKTAGHHEKTFSPQV
jgi:hypothetical protein